MLPLNAGHDGHRHVLPPFQPIERAIRLRGIAQDVGIQLAQAASGSHERAAGAHAGDKMGNRSVGLSPYLVGRRQVMSQPIGWIVILVGIVDRRILGGDATRLLRCSSSIKSATVKLRSLTRRG